MRERCSSVGGMKLQERHVLSCLVLAWLVVGDHASRRHVYREDLLCGVPPFCLRLTSLLSMSSRVFRSFPNRYYGHGWPWSVVCSNILRGTTTSCTWYSSCETFVYVCVPGMHVPYVPVHAPLMMLHGHPNSPTPAHPHL